MLLWHLIAIIVSIVLVVSGLDWRYFLDTRFPTLWSLFFPAVPIGGLLPIALPLVLLALGGICRSRSTWLTAWAISQAEVIGGVVAAGYKALTGRAHPARGVGTDLTHVFKFGLLRGGVFWGWPSSHTTIAFAMAVTVFKLYPKQKWLGYLAITYAFYIGLGVSITSIGFRISWQGRSSGPPSESWWRLASRAAEVPKASVTRCPPHFRPGWSQTHGYHR